MNAAASNITVILKRGHVIIWLRVNVSHDLCQLNSIFVVVRGFVVTTNMRIACKGIWADVPAMETR